MTDKQNILSEADDITSRGRRRFYGHPALNHGNTAAFWTSYLKRRYGVNAPELDVRAVCMMMVLLKISRDANLPNRDNLVDIAGYARNVEQADEPNVNPETGALGTVPPDDRGSSDKVAPPDARQPGENAYQHRTRVNSPWPVAPRSPSEIARLEEEVEVAGYIRTYVDPDLARIVRESKQRELDAHLNSVPFLRRNQRTGDTTRRIQPWDADLAAAHGHRRFCNRGRREDDVESKRNI